MIQIQINPILREQTIHVISYFDPIIRKTVYHTTSDIEEANTIYYTLCKANYLNITLYKIVSQIETKSFEF